MDAAPASRGGNKIHNIMRHQRIHKMASAALNHFQRLRAGHPFQPEAMHQQGGHLHPPWVKVRQKVFAQTEYEFHGLPLEIVAQGLIGIGFQPRPNGVGRPVFDQGLQFFRELNHAGGGAFIFPPMVNTSSNWSSTMTGTSNRLRGPHKSRSRR